MYCETINEVQDFLQDILEENNWIHKKALILNTQLEDKFKHFNLNSTKKVEDADFLLTTCESLIARYRLMEMVLLQGMDAKLSGDLLAIDIRQALYHFGEITGEITSDDLLGNIFANFCIGK